MRNSSPPSSPSPSPRPAPLPVTSTSLSATGCPELDLSVTLSPAHKTSHKTGLKPQRQGQTQRKRDTQVCSSKSVVVTVTPEPHVTITRDAPPHQPIRAPRLPATASNQDLLCLDKAELNTTLALKAELQSIQGTEFNFQKAIQETLQKSERTKNIINTRATEVVNVSRSQRLFSSLISVDVQKDQLISQVLQDRPQPATRPQGQDNAVADSPSLLHFLTPDLLRQNPLRPEEELDTHKLHPSPRPTHSTFDLYRRQRRWEATP